MASLNYRDSGTQQWVAVPVYEGPAGPSGAAGPTGAVAISGATGNTAATGTDGQLFVPAGGLDPTIAAALYVDAPGDAMTGELLVPDQVAAQPTDIRTAMTRGYVDQVVTVSDLDPVEAPVRNGQAWFVVQDKVPTTTTLTIDTPTAYVGDDFIVTATVTGSPVTVGSIQFKRDGVAFLAPIPVDPTGVAAITENLSAPGAYTYTAEYLPAGDFAGSASSSVSVTVSLRSTTTVLTSFDSTPTIGSTVAIWGATDGVGGSMQFMKNAAAFGSPVLVDPSGLAYAQPVVDAGATNWVAEYLGSPVSAPSTSNLLVITGILPASTTYLTVTDATVGYTGTCTASVSSGGVNLGAGTVQFTVDGVNIGGPVGFNGTNYTTTWVPSTVGPHTLVAYYSGDAGHSPSNDSDTANGNAMARLDITNRTPGNPVSRGTYINVNYHVGEVVSGAPGRGNVKTFFSWDAGKGMNYALDANGNGSRSLRVDSAAPIGNDQYIYCEFFANSGAYQTYTSGGSNLDIIA